MNFGGDNFNDRMVKYLTGQHERPKQNPSEHYWRATNDSRHNPSRNVQDVNVLQVQGRRIGVISYLSGVATDDSVTGPATGKMENKNWIKVPINFAGFKARMDLAGRVFQPFETTQAGDIFRALTVYKEKDPIDDETTQFLELWSSRVHSRLEKEAPSAYKWLAQHKDFSIHGQSLE